MALPGLHSFTMCDSTITFKVIGKKKPIKYLKKNPKFVLANLGASWEVSEELINGRGEFICIMYGRSSIKDVNTLQFVEKCADVELIPAMNIDMGKLPPCDDCFVQHIRRVNYQVAI